MDRSPRGNIRVGVASWRSAAPTHLSRCTQQEWLFRGDGVVPLVSVTLRQEKGCLVRSTLYIYRRGRSTRREHAS